MNKTDIEDRPDQNTGKPWSEMDRFEASLAAGTQIEQSPYSRKYAEICRQ